MSERLALAKSLDPRERGCPVGDVVPDALGLIGIWEVFTSQPGLGVMLIRPGGEIKFLNGSFIWEFMPVGVGPIVGRLIQDLYVEPIASEVLAAMNRVIGTKTQLTRRVVLRGFETQVTYRWLAERDAGPGHVLTTLQRGFRDPGLGKNVEVQHAGFINLGHLNVLSDRELEVFALVGEGLRVKEIGVALFRSHKTIESHMSSIYRKLNTSDRAVLMKIAHEAGLDLNMVRRPRVDEVLRDEE